MRQYEQILNKITPIFYKFLNNRMNFVIPYRTMFDYLKHFGLPEGIAVNIPVSVSQVNYIYAIKFLDLTSPIREKTATDHIIWLTKKDKISELRVLIDEAIVNMVINKFNFENFYIEIENFFYPQSYKDLFIALVGRNTYETIKKNIK